MFFFDWSSFFFFDLVEVAGGWCFWFDITIAPPSFDRLHGAGL
jgi:hypothetical protein